MGTDLLVISERILAKSARGDPSVVAEGIGAACAGAFETPQAIVRTKQLLKMFFKFIGWQTMRQRVNGGKCATISCLCQTIGLVRLSDQYEHARAERIA